jgi:hypothetical protein
MNMKRYFLVFYMFSGKDRGCWGKGIYPFITNGGYLNMKRTNKMILSENDTWKEVCIQNIIELSKSDYEDWIEE